MIQLDDLPELPIGRHSAPWLEHLIALFREQAHTIQEQTRIIQRQAEEITALKKTVQELRDELNRLKKMPKRPKFKPNGEHSIN